jgi:hypothetical protein
MFFHEPSSSTGLIDLDQLSLSLDLPRLAHGEAHVRDGKWNEGSLGCIEMAWIMGFIQHFDGRLKDGSLYVGWVESKTNGGQRSV